MAIDLKNYEPVLKYGGTISDAGEVIAGTTTLTTASANALAVGPNGATNPSLNVDASTASAATGLNIKSAAAAGGLALSVITSGTNENLTIDAASAGTITLNGTGTGNIVAARLLTVLNGAGIDTTAAGSLLLGATTATSIALGGTAVTAITTPVTTTGTITIGLSTGTGNITVGSSSGGQSVLIANGAGAPTVNIASVSTAGATIAMANAATAGTAVDVVNIATGNAASTAKKQVNIATGVPNTTGNNQVMIGGGTKSAVTTNAVATMYQAWNYISSETGGNNALVAALTDANGNNVTVAAGLRILLKSAHTTQAGANTLNLNGHGTDSIKKHTAPGTDLATAYANGSIIDLTFDGTVWQDMAQ